MIPKQTVNLALQPTTESQKLVDELELFYRENVEYFH